MGPASCEVQAEEHRLDALYGQRLRQHGARCAQQRPQGAALVDVKVVAAYVVVGEAADDGLGGGGEEGREKGLLRRWSLAAAEANENLLPLQLAAMHVARIPGVFVWVRHVHHPPARAAIAAAWATAGHLAAGWGWLGGQAPGPAAVL